MRMRKLTHRLLFPLDFLGIFSKFLVEAVTERGPEFHRIALSFCLGVGVWVLVQTRVGNVQLCPSGKGGPVLQYMALFMHVSSF